MCNVPVSKNEGKLLTSVLASRLDRFEVLNGIVLNSNPGQPESLRMEYSLCTSFGLGADAAESSTQAQSHPYLEVQLR